MKSQGSTNAACFLAVLFLLVAWKLAPSVDGDPYYYLPSGMFAVIGALTFIGGVLRAEHRPPPFGKSLVARTFWLLRPRGWMIAWTLIVAAAHLWGTPHLRVQYALTPIKSTCDFVGWNGVQSLTFPGFGCPAIAWIRPV